MFAMRAEQFSGYEALKRIELPKPAVSDGRVLLRMTAAGVTPLDHTILSGQFHHSKAPLVLGNEGAGVVEGLNLILHLFRFVKANVIKAARVGAGNAGTF